MGFSTNTFLFVFLLGTLAVYIPVSLILPRLRVTVLLIASVIFYAWASVSALPVLFLLIIINYLAGIAIDRSKKGLIDVKPVTALGISVFIDVAILIIFKYTKFILGISFMTLSGISYLADIYRGKVKAQINIIRYALYMAFFVKIIEGPIVRYSDVSDQIRKPEVSLERFTEGIRRFSVGLAKKVLLADQLGVVAHDILGTSNNSPALAWLGIISYTLQLYLDFSGYTDMAIGLAKMFGFDFKENFNNPYVSLSLSEFWRRWHISLSRWLRDYIYIPLGGSKSGMTYLNLFVTFLIAGFWHGATWNYCIWGAWNGLILCIERWGRRHVRFTFPVIVRRIVTLFVIVIGWVFFYFEDIGEGFRFLPTLFGYGSTWNSGFTLRWYLSQRIITILFISVIACTPIFDKMGERFRKNRLWDLFYLGLLAVSILIVMSSTFQSFLYIRY
ncbi:MAG: MBOAT family O-acyltransferase [Lachnospiraceae bacterium]|nr:MBOAT family O-acyltransferase [Lachnospiraceae bacterium]